METRSRYREWGFSQDEMTRISRVTLSNLKLLLLFRLSRQTTLSHREKEKQCSITATETIARKNT